MTPPLGALRRILAGTTPARLALHAALAAAAGFCTLLTGTGFHPRLSDVGLGTHLGLLLREPQLLLSGLGYAAPLLLILLVHECGHLVAAARWGVDASLPYFLPGPPFITLGTFGAFIRLRTPIPNRRALLQIGAWGPFAGFFLSLAAGVAGFALLRAGYRVPSDFFGANVRLPIALWALQGLFTGNWSHQVLFFENPVIAAAWLGFFFQGLNLLPVGQLDGGHVAYALSKGLHRWLGRALMVVLAGSVLWGPQWILWILILLTLGLRHPPCMDETQPLGPADRWAAVAALLVFLVCFHPAPFAL